MRPVSLSLLTIALLTSPGFPDLDQDLDFTRDFMDALGPTNHTNKSSYTTTDR